MCSKGDLLASDTSLSFASQFFTSLPFRYEGDSYARIGVMPRYGNADSIKWFELEPHCTFHILNCFEDGHEVVVRGCRAPWSIVPGLGRSKSEFSSQKSDVQSAEELFFSCAYEWRVNIEIGDVKEKNLTGTDLTMDMPFINDKFTGLRNAYGYTLVADSYASSECGLPKYGSLAKLYFEEKNKTSKSEEGGEDRIKVEYHLLEENQFYSGAAFVSKQGGLREDDGWVISFVHSEDTNISQNCGQSASQCFDVFTEVPEQCKLFKDWRSGDNAASAILPSPEIATTK
ncbi:hypothetical protein ACLOJK_026629 [Asimina triloba]